jgi:hypothetical protein
MPQFEFLANSAVKGSLQAEIKRRSPQRTRRKSRKEREEIQIEVLLQNHAH